MRTKFRASPWKDNQNDWHVMYLCAECRGLQKTVTGHVVDVGAGSQMWSGIRGLSGLNQVVAEFAAELLNLPTWVWCGNTVRFDGDIMGEILENQPRQPGDNFLVPRNVMGWALVDGRRAVEWFCDAETARIWVMATAARDLAASGYVLTNGICSDCGLPLDEYGQCSSYLTGCPCAAIVGPLEAV